MLFVNPVPISIHRITPTLGATVKLSPNSVLDVGVPEQILDALNRFGVLVFPQIGISDDQMVELTSQLGDMGAVKATADGSNTSEKGIYRIALDKQDKSQREYVEGNNFWHMDGTSYDAPGKATLLKCVVPPGSGGDTEFANLHAAYAALPEEKKKSLSELTVVHCLEPVGRRLVAQPTEDDLARWNTTFPPTEHPLVWHQCNGETSLLIGATAKGIVGMSDEEGAAFLQELLEWCTQGQFTYRHCWRQGDLVIWNNPALLHRSIPYTEASGRLMHRTTLKGEEAITSAS